jgi:hypothetical protein
MNGRNIVLNKFKAPTSDDHPVCVNMMVFIYSSDRCLLTHQLRAALPTYYNQQHIH